MRLKRFFLIFIFLSCSLFLWKLWVVKIHKNNFVKTEILYNILEKKIKSHKNQLVHVKTDVIDIKINLYNGDICQSRLLNYQDQLQSFKKLQLIRNNNFAKDVISSGVWYKKTTLHYKKKIQYNTYRTNFKLLNGQKILFVPCFLNTKYGVRIVKTFIFKKGSYDIGVEYKIYNHSSRKISYYICGMLKHSNLYSHINANISDYNFEDFAYSKNHGNYKKYNLYEFLKQKKLHFISTDGWIAFLQKYFSIAWILDKSTQNIICISHDNSNNVTVWYKTFKIIISPNHKILKRTILWIGPKIQNKMACIAPYFDNTIDYGWFWFLSKPLFIFLNALHRVLNNWGYAIILITCIIRIITYPLMKAQYLSTIKMKLLQPEIDYLKKKFNNNQRNLNNKILKLYKKNHINPLSGLFPVLLQMPIFLALYYMLVNVVELRHAPFALWINDLSAQDPLYILPILMGVTIFFMQKTAPTNYFPLSTQEKLINFTPILFIFFFLWFPSGLVLYYIVSNLVTILQQIIIHRSLKDNIKFKL